MDVSTLILRKLDTIDRKQDELLGNTAPRMPQLWAALVGLFTCAIGSYVLENGNIQYLSPLYEEASDYVANNAATAGIWMGDIFGNIDRSLPDLPVNASTDTLIRGLDPVQSCRLMVAMRGKESTHNYQQPGNWAGYIGGYQFGATALAAVGLINNEAVRTAHANVRKGLPPQHVQFIQNQRNWRGGWDYQKYLSSPMIQDQAFLSLANLNVSAGFSARALSKTQPERIAGYVAAAHLKGSGAANSWYLRGKNSRDGNGTSTADYAKFGERAINMRSKYCNEKPEPTAIWKILE